MTGQHISLAEAIQQFDRQSIEERREGAERERLAIVERFPIEQWPSLPLESYALGQEDSEDTYCRWLEFRSQSIASMKGGSARKLIIYKHANQPGWYFDNSYESLETAWQALRAGFVEAFSKASAGQWDEIDDIAALHGGPALRMKSLYVYFPTHVLPICACPHIKHFLQRVKPSAHDTSYDVVRLNRELLAALREVPELSDWSTWELAVLMYDWADPRESRRIVKIAPGENARFWDDCLSGGYICVGWDAIGDIGRFESKEEYRAQFDEVFFERHSGKKAKLTQKANELWTLRELEPGDLVVANKGTSQVLAVGEVVEPGYEYMPDREEYQKVVRVKWDTSFAAEIPPQKRWAFVTVAKVPTDLYETIIGKKSGPSPVVPVDPFYKEIAAALERKGQVILYGPPGTGKTYHARRFAVWWLLHNSGNKDAAAILADAECFSERERALSTLQVNQRVWYIVANPKEWTWDRLRKDRKTDYQYGRLQRNYPLVQPGDLVIGYQATPDKRVVALARISRGLEKAGGQEPTIEVAYLQDVQNGLTYEELLADDLLSQSEPLRFNNQGTLFALTPNEAARLLSLLAERDASVERHFVDSSGVGQLTRLTFHPSYSYEDFIEGFRPVESSSTSGLTLGLEDGVFKRVCREAQAHPDRQYLLLIDEINRANVAKVLGELITLMEKDKRGLIVTLPQSKESFAIPPNVYLLGTMNTADRSIKLLDAALRRRFAFIEMMPDVELLHGAKVGGLELDEFLMALNARVAEHVGREKQIGHSFFMEDGQPVTDVDSFAERFRQEVLPLLQEYCYDDYATLARYIGDALVNGEEQTLNNDKLNDSESLIAALEDEYGSAKEEET